MRKTEFDFIVVGGGSSGSVVAGRLSEQAGNDVLVIEEGPRDWHPWIKIPVMVYKTATGNLLRRIVCETSGTPPQKFTTVQGRVLGGGSSVNGMVHVRGIPSDYDRWEASGAKGWSYEDNLPYFKKAEGNDTFSNEVHSPDGPLSVSSPAHLHPLTRAWVQACQENGIPFNPDFNSGNQTGCGYYQTTTRDGRRCSAAMAYLHPAQGRPNLTIETNKTVLRVLFEGNRAVGVEVLDGNEVVTIRARREVILSAGTVNSARLLLLSGVGPGEQLRRLGTPVVSDLRGVGRNLQDHTEIYLVYQLSDSRSYDKYKAWRPKLWAGLQYGLFKTGPACSNVIEGGAFWWGDSIETHPDIQFCFLAGSGVEEGVEPIVGADGITLNSGLTRPRSRGYLELVSKDPRSAARVVPNYLSEPTDVERMAEGVRIGQEIMSRPAISRHLKGLHLPKRPLRTTTDYQDYVRERAQGALHMVGTCRIGVNEDSVVDCSLRVHGVENLRVADASVMPNIVSGNTNAASIMIGERAADLIQRNPR